MVTRSSRRSFLSLSLAASAAAVAPRWALAQARPAAPAQADPSTTPVTKTRLAENLFLLQGVGGNMALQFGPDGLLLIDSSYAPAVPRIQEAIASLAPAAAPGSILINTHWHPDHTGGNLGLHQAGFRILAHRNTRTRLSTEQTVKMFHMTMPPQPEGAWPTAVLDESLSLFRNGDAIDLKHLPPAHTDTDLWVYFEKADVLHCGDLFFNGVFPVIDESSGGSIGGMIAAGEQILAKTGDATKIIPGHGPLATRADFERFLIMLKTVRDKVATLKAQGMSEQAVVAKDPTADYDATLGRGFMKAEVFVGVVYRTL